MVPPIRGRVTLPLEELIVFTISPFGFRTSIRKLVALFPVQVSVEVSESRAELGLTVSQVQAELIVPTTISATS